MTDRTDLPKIHPQAEPSLFNDKAVEWGTNTALIGGVIENLSGLGKKIGDAKATALVYGGAAAAALWGGTQGKAEQEKEKIEGRTVKDPGYWNKGILTGLLIGGMPAEMLQLQGKKSYMRLGMMGMAAGAIIGSILRKNSLQSDFDQALAQRDADYKELEGLRLEKEIRAEQTSPAPAASFTNTVTPEEARILESAQNHPRETRSHQETLKHQTATARPSHNHP